MSRYDRGLERAISQLSDDFGAVDRAAVDRDLAASVETFGLAAVDGDVPDGVLLDVNRRRREITFRHLYQRLVTELLGGLPDGAQVSVGNLTYRVDTVRDRLHPQLATGLIRGQNLLLGCSDPIVQPAGRLRWGIPDDAFRLVEERQAFRHAKALRQNAVGPVAGGQEGAGVGL